MIEFLIALLGTVFAAMANAALAAAVAYVSAAL